MRGGLLEAAGERVGLEHADLRVEAVEEPHVPGLVGDLGREEDLHVLGRRGASSSGPSSSVTRCSPMKNDDRPYIR